MKQRIVTGAVLLLLMILIFCLSHTWVYAAIMTLLCAVGTWEMLGCIGQRSNLYLSLPAMVLSVASPTLSYFFGYGTMLAVVMVYMVLLLALAVFFDEKVKLTDVSQVFVTTLYVVMCFTALLRLRYIENVGQYVYILVFVAAWITDTFAYFVGVFFGKHKLIPKISPKKTVEGSVGGVVFCVIAFVVYGIILRRSFGVEVHMAALAVVGLVMSLFSQLGDLIASAIKRTYGIKDYGNVFPGHGGIIDRFDSIMILSPFLLLIAENVNFLVG